jgi:Steigviridae/Suoliviridae L,D-carboxypeptidase/transpeptidase
MGWLVRRRWPTSLSVEGELWHDSEFECYTLEPPYKTDDSKPRAIPVGTYDLDIRLSPHFGRLMPHVENVPGFTDIMIHYGNYPQDTEGCTIVGAIRGSDFVGHSRDEFNALFLRIQDALAAGPQTITYMDAPISSPDVDGEVSV